MFLRTRARLVDAKCIIVLHIYIHDNIPTYACTWQDSQWTCTALVRHPPPIPPWGGHRARYLDSLASAAVGVLAARACGPCPTRPVGGTRGLCRSNSPATHALRVFSPKKNSNIIATNRNNTSVVIFVQYTNNCFFFIYYATSYYRYYVEFKNFESKCVLSHPHHCPVSSFLVSFFFF